MTETIKVRYLSDKVQELEYISNKSDWIDLRAAGDVELKQGEFKLIPLGVAMQLPAGYEAHMIPAALHTRTLASFRPTTWGCSTRAIAAIMTSGISQPLP